MSQHSESETEIEIQKTLALINDVTVNIKKELMHINDLVRENGRLNTAANDTNRILFGIARDAKNKQTEGRTDVEENLDKSENFTIPLNPDDILEKLNSIIQAHP